MQRIKVLRRYITGTTENVDSMSLPNYQNLDTLKNKNNYWVYSSEFGKSIVNENNVKEYLDQDENSEISEKFINYLQNNLTAAEFREVFYDNKKLSTLFNDFYTETILKNQNPSQAIISATLIDSQTRAHVEESYFDGQNQRLTRTRAHVFNSQFSGDSYYINVYTESTNKTVERGDYSQYFADCIKGTYTYTRYTNINSVSSNTVFANIPYFKNRRGNHSFGEAITTEELLNVISNNLVNENTTRFEFQTMSDFVNFFNFQPQELTTNVPGIFISQFGIDNPITFISNTNINNSSSSSSSSGSEYDYNIANSYSARFIPQPIIYWDKINNPNLTIPIKIQLNTTSVNTTYLYVNFERYSTATLTSDFILNRASPNSSSILIGILNGQRSTTINTIGLNDLTPEETSVLTLRDEDNNILSFLIIRCEMMMPATTYTNNSYLLINNETRNKVMLNCFVDLKYTDNESAFYINGNVNIIDTRPQQGVLTNNISSGRLSSSSVVNGFDINKIISITGLDNSAIRNIYLYGSRVYGTNHQNSDFDVRIVADINTPERSVNSGNYQIKIYSLNRFQEGIAKNEFPFVEFQFFPEWAKIRETSPYMAPIVNQRVKYSAIDYLNYHLELIKRGFNNSKDLYVLSKNLFHAIRVLVFAGELISTGTIADITIAKPYYDDIFRHNFQSYEQMIAVYGDLIEKLKKKLG
mgnify:CR=1 FL=1